jgi:ornithine carbamoyltransferase
MSYNLRQRSFLKLLDLTPRDLRYLLDLAHELKRAKAAGTEAPRLAGKNIALIFEKASTRTRCAFEVAVHDQGGHVTTMDAGGSQLGKKESIKDTARVLSRLYDGIEYRGAHQADIETLARFAHVPVFNGLTDEFHPTQVLADLMTMEEFGEQPLHTLSMCYLGDARFNMGNSLLIGGAMMGMDVRLCAPKALWPDDRILASARRIAASTGAQLMLHDDPDVVLPGADFVYTDVWVSMGEPDSVWAERIAMLKPYQVDSAKMKATGKPRTRFMHCLPAFHGVDTEVGRQVHERYGLDAMEVTDEVFESEASIVFTQAENRMHTIKAVLVATLGS